MEASLDVRHYDCCINGCKAYTGGYEGATVCDSCHECRFLYVSESLRSCSVTALTGAYDM
jgi:hypothetical protein